MLKRQHFQCDRGTIPGISGSTVNRSNHHRYGEVKTRLTIGASGDFASLSLWNEVLGRHAKQVQKNGQVTVPKGVRDYLGLCTGTEVVFRPAADGAVVIERADGTRPPSRFAKLVGIAGPGPLYGRVYGATPRRRLNGPGK